MKFTLVQGLFCFGGLVAAGYFCRPVLLAAWLFSLLILPTAQIEAGRAPIYVFDVAAVAAIIVLILRGDLLRWPRGVPRWHLWMIGAAFLLSVIFGALRYGAAPESLWIWAHAGLAWMAFAIAIAVICSDRREAMLRGIHWGLLSSLALLCPIAVIQFADLPMSEAIARLFYSHLGEDRSVDLLRVIVDTSRANGPHFAPTTLAGMALLAAVAFWLSTTRENRAQRALVLVLSAVTILCTVSRHALLAAGLGFLVAVLLHDGRSKVRMLAVCGVLVAIGLAAGGVMLRETWDNRMARLDGGVLGDDNIAARLLWGPARLAEFLTEHPSVLVTGAGLDPEKLLARSGLDGDFEGGFVSNSFLLALYYLGVGGFALYVGFWGYLLYSAATAAREFRPLACGSAVIAVITVAADNYGFMYEPAAALLFLIAGLIVAQRHLTSVPEDELDSDLESDPAEEEEVYVH